jgi:hypothetical protein
MHWGATTYGVPNTNPNAQQPSVFFQMIIHT